MTIKFQLNNNVEKKITFKGKFNINKFNQSRINKNNIKKITIGREVTDLDNEVFMNLNNLVKVELNNSILTHYGYLTFKNCVKLNNILDSPNLKKLNNSTFRNTGFTTYKCPDSLKEMTNYNFKDSIKLEKVNLNKLETLGKENFKNCASLNKVTLSKNLKTIGFRNFENCHKLTTVDFNDTKKLETIGQSSFYNCSGLKSIDFPKSLKNIGLSSFQNTGLENIIIPLTFDGVKITVSNNAFKNCNKIKKIFLSKINTNPIKKAFNFSNYPTNVEKPKIYYYDNVNFLWEGEINEQNELIKTDRIVNVFDENKNILPMFKNLQQRLNKNGMILIPPLDTVYLADTKSLENFNKNLKNNNNITLNKIKFTRITDKIENKAGIHYIDYADKDNHYILKQKIVVDTGNITLTKSEDIYGGKHTYLITNRSLDGLSFIKDNNDKVLYPPYLNIIPNNSLVEYYQETNNFMEKIKENEIIDKNGNIIPKPIKKSFKYNYKVKSTFPNKNVQVNGTRTVIVLFGVEGEIKTLTSSNDKINFKLGTQEIKDPLLDKKIYYDVPYKNYRALFSSPYLFQNDNLKIKSNWNEKVKKKNQYGLYKVTYSLVDSIGADISKTFDVEIYGKELHSTVLGSGAFAKHGKNLNTYNVAIGNNALNNINKSHRNVAIGSNSMSQSKVKSDSNTAVGFNSLSNATNVRNIGIGVNAGKNIRNGIDNIFIGKNVDVTINKNKDIYGTNQIVIGNDTQGDDDSILLNQKNILPGKEDITLGDKNFKFDNIYSTKIVNGDLQLTLPTNKLSGDRYLEVDGDGNIKFITLENILAGL